MRELVQELRTAFRSLRRAPASTAIAIAILALTIGATTMLWQALQTAVLRPLPYPDADRLITIFDLHEGTPWVLSPPNFADYRDQVPSLASLAAYDEGSYALSGNEGPAEQVPGVQVTSDFFRTLRLDAARGRILGPEDDQEAVVVLSDELWRRRYGADPELLGRSIRVDGTSRRVVGILPPGRGFPFDSRLWIPLAFSAETLQTQRGAHWLGAVGRITEDGSLDGVNAELRAVAARNAASFPRTNQNLSAEARLLQDWILRGARSTLALLLGGVALALLAACVNLANVSLARTVARGPELALKSSLGAGVGRLARTLLLENIVLAGVSALVGGALAMFGADQLPALLGGVPRLEGLKVDDAGFGALVLLGGLAGLLIGIAPASFALRRDPAEVLRRGGYRVAGSRGAGRVRRMLVVVTTALALILVAGATLLLRSYRAVATVDPGFDPSGRLLFSVSLPPSDYPAPEDVARFTSELQGKLRAMPGVESAAAVFGQPFGGFSYAISLHSLDGRRLEDENGPMAGYEHRRSSQIRFVTPGYFRALGIPLRAGRLFTEADRFGSPNVVIASESAARLTFDRDDPLGHTLEISTTAELGRGRVGGEVVGIVGDIREQQLDDDPWPTLYFVQDQFPVDFLTFVIRADPARLDGLIPPARRAVAELNPDLPIFRVRTLDQLLAESLATRRILARLLAGFALLAMVLAALGLFGILNQSVTERRRELAVRGALGATPSTLAVYVLRQAGALAALGLLLGLAVTLALSRYLAAVLYRLSPTDPATLIVASLALLLVALAAGWMPARRVLRLDPMTALREE